MCRNTIIALLVAALSSSAFAAPVRFMTSSEPNSYGRHIFLKITEAETQGDAADPTYIFEKCESSAPIVYSETGFPLVEDCVTIGNHRGYRRSDIMNRLDELNTKMGELKWWALGGAAVSFVVGALLGKATVSMPGSSLPNQLFGMSVFGSVFGLGGGVLTYLLVRAFSYDEVGDGQNALQEGVELSRSDSIMKTRDYFNMAQLISDLQKVLIGIK